jgi:hypothetical protein
MAGLGWPELLICALGVLALVGVALLVGAAGRTQRGGAGNYVSAEPALKSGASVPESHETHAPSRCASCGSKTDLRECDDCGEILCEDCGSTGYGPFLCEDCENTLDAMNAGARGF